MRKLRYILLLLLPAALWVLTRQGRAPEKAAEPIAVQPEAAPPAAEPVPADSGIALVSGGKPAGFEWTDRNPAAKRVRKIVPDPAWMTSSPTLKAGDVIELALFDDAVFKAKVRNVTVYPNGAVGATAHLKGDERGTVYLSYCNGQLRASVEVRGGADYAIRYLTDRNAHYALEVDRENSIILEGAEPLQIPVSDALHAPAAEPQTTPDPVAAADAPAGSTLIDVMIVYTPAALAIEGNVAEMNNNIGLAMQKANEAHTNSNTQIYLRLVHSAQVDYVEDEAKTDLDKLTYFGGSNSDMDEVHDWRDEYGADFVCLLEDDPYYTDVGLIGGLGWVLNNQNGSPSYAFCLARVQQTDRTYTVVHEWGHNMGCGHSKTQESYPGPGLYGYSAGWQWSDTKPYGVDGYCTVMTYQGFGYGYEYKRVAHFSNPDISYTGDGTNPTGDAADGDNARTMRELKDMLAAYRDTTVPLDDLDNDGLPGWWEEQFFGSETAANTNDPAANGLNSVLEAYIAGIDPTDPSSFFKTALTNQNGFVVRWNATSGRVYSVFGSADLQSGFQPLETNILWPQSSWTDTVNRAGQFYKVDVELE